MSKKHKKKPPPSPIESLVAHFDEALFDNLVREKENELRSEFAVNGISKRLFNLERKYGSRDTAYRVLAEEKVWKKIYCKRHPDKPEETCKSFAQQRVAQDHVRKQKISHPSHKVAEKDWTSGTTSRTTGNWRHWGYA